MSDPPKKAPEPVTGAMPLPKVTPPAAEKRGAPEPITGATKPPKDAPSPASPASGGFKTAPDPVTAAMPRFSFDDAPTSPRQGAFVPPEALRDDADDLDDKTAAVPAFKAGGGADFEDPTRDVSLGAQADPLRINLDDEAASRNGLAGRRAP